MRYLLFAWLIVWLGMKQKCMGDAERKLRLTWAGDMFGEDDIRR